MPRLTRPKPVPKPARYRPVRAEAPALVTVGDDVRTTEGISAQADIAFDGVVPAPEVITKRRTRKHDGALAQEYASDSPSDDHRARIRERALASTYYFATTVCSFADLKPVPHGLMAQWIQRPSALKLGLAPRGHLKSHVWTIADTLRWVTHDPHRRALVTNETLDNIKKWISVMQGIVLSPVYQWLFPEVIPDPRNVRWNQTQLELKRTRPLPQPTIEGIGIGGASTSNHYERCINDDPVGKEARESPSVMGKAIDHRKLCWSLLVNPATDSIYDVGTRWTPTDYADWVQRNVDNLDYFKLGIYGPDGKPIWPERFTPEVIAALRKEQGSAMFSLQYLNEPLAQGATEWDPRLLRWWDYAPGRSDAIVLERPPSEGGPKLVTLAEMTKWQTIDAGLSPESPDARTANVVVGLCPPASGDDLAFDIVVLDAVAKHSAPKQTVYDAYELHERWNVDTAAIEVFGGHVTFFYWIPSVFPNMRLRKLPTDTHKSKLSRIRGFYPFVEQGRVYVHRDQVDLLAEYEAFPNGRTVDLLDALAYAPAIWAPPEPRQSDDPNDIVRRWMRETGQDETEGDSADGRSRLTGY